MQTSRSRDDEAIARAQFLDAKKRDDVLQFLVMRDRLAHLFGNAIMLVTDNLCIEQIDEELNGSTAGYMPSAAIDRDSTIMLSRWLEIAVTAGSVKSWAGTSTASIAVTETPETDAIRSCKAATSVASVG